MDENDPGAGGAQDMEQMKQQCIFCQIISGKAMSKRVYEDDKFLAILDINPANPGHVLVLPKEHHSIMPLMPADEVKQMARVAKRISTAQIRALGVEGTNIFVANGSAAGQKAPHFMMHVIPRKKGDNITVFKLPTNQITPQDQEKLRVAIKMQVNAKFGITDPIIGEDVEEEEPVEEEQAETAAAPAPEPEKAETPAPPGKESGQEEAGEEPKKGFNLDKISSLFK